MAFTIDPNALTTLANVRQHLGITKVDANLDDILTRMINSATFKIENFLDRRVKKRAYTHYFDGRQNDRLLLKEWPIDKPTVLAIDSDSLFPTETELDATDFEIDPDGGDSPYGIILLGGRQFPKGRRNIKVVYEAGFDDVSTDVPDIEEACLFTVEFLFDMRDDRRIGISSKSKNNENTSFLGDLPEFVVGMLQKYQRTDFFSTVPVSNR